MFSYYSLYFQAQKRNGRKVSGNGQFENGNEKLDKKITKFVRETVLRRIKYSEQTRTGIRCAVAEKYFGIVPRKQGFRLVFQYPEEKKRKDAAAVTRVAFVRFCFTMDLGFSQKRQWNPHLGNAQHKYDRKDETNKP